LRRFVLDGADDAEAEVANVHTERMLWLLYHVNVLVNELVLDIEFRQLLNVVKLELLANGRSLREVTPLAAAATRKEDRMPSRATTQRRLQMQRRHWRRL
jgi:hypothetical protein